MNANAIPPSWNTIDKAVKAYKSGQKAVAFNSIGQMRFKTALTKKEQEIIAVAGAFLSGNARFYVQLGWDQETVILEATKLFESKFLEN